MGMSNLEIERVMIELQSLKGALLHKVHQPSRTELILNLRTREGRCWLMLSIHPNLSRMHVASSKPSNPGKPFAFQMACRKELGGRLEALEVVNNDRLVRLTFQGATRRHLLVELMDRHGNLFLLDAQDSILATMRPGHKNHRGVAQGQIWTGPPTPPPRRIPRDRFATHLEDQTLSQAIETWAKLEQSRLELHNLRGRLESALRRELKRLNRLQRQLDGDLERAERAEQHRRYGDLLQIHLGSILRGRTWVAVQDSFSEDPDARVEVPLDPSLSPIANVQRHYKLYRKYDASIPVVLERQEAAETALTRRTQELAKVQEANTLENLKAIEAKLVLPKRQKALIRSGSSQDRRPTFLRYLTQHAQEIWVGRSGTDNDQLTFRAARGNDFWLHVRGRPGAHVVIPVRGKTPDLETLLDAASLAMRHSGLGWGDHIEVAYTRVKHVRRIPGAHPGLVTFSQDKSLHVTLEEDRLARLVREEESG